MGELPRLLAVLAHEMRTPIAAILGYQELLAEGVYGHVDERGREPLERIAYAARQLLHLIDGVQEISVPEAALTRNIVNFEPAAVLRECISRAADDATGRSVTLHFELPEQLPLMRADAERFCRSIELALSAAMKASPGGSLNFTVGSKADVLHVTIAHTGLSLERDNPDFVDVNGNGEMSGPALRLAIARHIAREMHGDLLMRADDSGTSLHLTFQHTA